MIGNISKSKAEKGDPLTFDMLTEAEKASLSPKPDWNQTDETKADFIKNKPDLTKYATKEELNQEKFIRCDYEDIDSISTAGKYIVSVPDEKLPVRGDAYLFVSNVIANNNQFHQILIGADGTITKRSGNNSGSLDGVTKTIWSEWQTYATKEEIANVGGGASITVDTELSKDSTNPVQNKVVTKAIDSIRARAVSNEESIVDIMDGKVSIPATTDIKGNVIHTTYATKAEVGEKVSFSDYATNNTAGVVKAFDGTHSSYGVKINSDGKLQIDCAYGEEIRAKASQNSPITPAYADVVVNAATHQTMSDDYDVSSLVLCATESGKQGGYPVSYDAVKGYINSQVGDISTALDAIIALDNKLLGVSE